MALLWLHILFFSFFGQKNTDLPAYAVDQDSLTVYIFLQPECVISQYFTPELNQLYHNYRGKHIGFLGLFPNPGIDETDIMKFDSAFLIDYPLQIDAGASIARAMEATITPEVVVIDHRTNSKIYQGRINDSFVRVGKRKQHIQSNDLDDVLSKWCTSGANQPFVNTKAIGCLINFTTNPAN